MVDRANHPTRQERVQVGGRGAPGPRTLVSRFAAILGTFGSEGAVR